MEYKLILGLIILSILSAIVFASDAPPPIPTEYWGIATIDGAPAADGLNVQAFSGSTNYAQPSTTINGSYNVILVGGDSPLTYNGDRDCSIHRGNGEACIPCDNESDCIEGPQDGDLITLKIDNEQVMPLCLSWDKGNSTEIEAISPIGDWSKNGCVNLATDFPPFGTHYDFTCSDPGWDIIYDLNCDCVINLAGDFPIFGIHYEEGCEG